MFAPRSPAGLNKATDALPISQRGDPSEREATQIADRVMRMPAPFAHGRSSVGWAAPVAPMAPLAVHPDRDGSSADARAGASAVAMAIRAIATSPGAPLESTTRAEFEQRFGHSFANVRVHTDADAISGARALVPYSGFFDITSRRELGLLRAAVLYANPAVISVDDTRPEALPEIGTVRDIDGHQYVVIGNYVGL
jgi:hypothetical protein